MRAPGGRLNGAGRAQGGKQNGAGRSIDSREITVTSLVGTLQTDGGAYYVRPDDRKIPEPVQIRKKDLGGARNGQKVLIEITGRGAGDGGYKYFGKVTEVIGYAGSPGVDILSVLFAHGFASEFPDAAVREAETVPDRLDMRRAKGRRDLRNERLFTIDGEDSKDLDDAVSIQRYCEAAGGRIPDNDGGGDAGHNAIEPAQPDYAYKLGVHIADVAAYVPRGSALDAEAYRRGTSLYYADRVAPMLPQKLSNGICSLHPHEDRLALTVYMYIDAKGEVVSHEIFESVINSAERMTYKNVYNILEGLDEELNRRYESVAGDLEVMRELALLLKERRLARGALDFVTREAVITLNEKGAPLEVRAYESTYANQLIEEFMILCNETVAKHMTEAGYPFIYRTHDRPDPEKLSNFLELASSLGLYNQPAGQKIAADSFSPSKLQKILDSSRGRGCEALISLIMLRTMAKAGYTPNNIGHYGLASACYCHFTSPIRRYPDLLIHRIIKAELRRGLTRGDRDMYEKTLGAICESCSERERAADDTEREIESMKKAEYMRRFLGEGFTGKVSGVTSFGMFVELDNTVEGLVRLSDMPDYFVFDSARLTLVGEHSGARYAIGDVVNVVLTRADPDTRQIDFVLAQPARRL